MSNNNKEIIQFQFQDLEIRVIEDSQGQPWFVAKDVCDALEITDTNSALRGLDDDEKGTHKVRTLGGSQDMLTVNESGLYAFIIRSNKPKAKEFRKWITAEVLPSLRKTGSYSTSTALLPVPPAPVGANVPVIPMPTIDATGLAKEVKAWRSIGKTLGFQDNQNILFTCNAIKRRYRIDLMDMLDAPTHLVAKDQGARHFSVTELAGRIGLSAVKMNKLLCEQQFQEAQRDAKKNVYYMPTDKGKPFAVLTDAGKQHSNGTPIQQLRWLESVLEHVEIPVNRGSR